MSLDDKCRRADFVIENSGSVDDTRQQVAAVHAKLSSSRLHWRIRLAIGVAVGGVVGLLYYVAKKCLAMGGGRNKILEL